MTRKKRNSHNGKNNSHYHSHSHAHSHISNTSNKNIIKVVILNFSITIAQIVGGLISNSLSLLSDALHNLGDSSAIFIAFWANKISTKKANEQYTFGYRRVEILTALFNATILIAICIFLLYEAYHRRINPERINGPLMLIIATIGLLANIISVFFLHKDKNHNINIKTAYLHLIGDTLSSIAVIIGGISIWLYNIVWIDPIITVLVSLYIIYHTRGIIKQTIDILMQSTPTHINIEKLQTTIEKIPKVQNIHHIHIWKLDDIHIHCEAHINLIENMKLSKMMEIKQEIEKKLESNFGITHTTLQIGYNCCKDNSALINKINCKV